MVKPTFKAVIDLDAVPEKPAPDVPPGAPPLTRQEAQVVDESSSTNSLSIEEAKPSPPRPPMGQPVPMMCDVSTCANEPYDPVCLFQALFGSFLAGAAVGGLLVYAFSSSEYEVVD